MRKIEANDNLIREFIKDPRYHVTPNGIVWTCINMQGHIKEVWRIKHQCISPEGYCRLRYKNKMLAVHRIVYEKFHKNLRADMQVNHINGVRYDNSKDNLEQLYPSENMRHSYSKLKRQTCYSARKLTDNEADSIRLLHAQGKPYSKLMKQFKVSKATISYVINDKTYVKGRK